MGETPSTLTCTTAPKRGEPLVVDWKTNDQLDLTVAMKKGVAVVAYDCKSIRLLKDCSVKGKYGFTAVPSIIQEAIKIDNADEAHASMPMSGGTIGGSISSGSSIDIALEYVGKQAALINGVAKDDLVGSECSDATHFVRGATLGAFVIATGTKGEAKAAAQLFAANAGAASSSSKSKLNAGGDPEACKQIKDGAEKAPDACSSVVRLDLLAIGSEPKESGGAALENTCPDGYAPSGGHCANKSRASAKFRCDPTNVPECKKNCESGDLDSCYNAGRALIVGAQVGGAEQKEVAPLFDKACAGGIGDACGWIARLEMNGGANNSVKALAFAKKGCDGLSTIGCSAAATLTKDDERIAVLKKGCDLGDLDSCDRLGRAYLTGTDKVQKRTTDGLALLDSTCDAGTLVACADLTRVYQTGKLSSSEKTDVTPDPPKRLTAATKYCKLKPKGGDGIKCPADDGTSQTTAAATTAPTSSSAPAAKPATTKGAKPGKKGAKK